MFKKKSNFIKKPRPVPKNCRYCAAGTDPDFRDTESLRVYLTERGKILPHTLTGICAKHQRRLADAIKYARHLALISFVNRI